MSRYNELKPFKFRKLEPTTYSSLLQWLYKKGILIRKEIEVDKPVEELCALIKSRQRQKEFHTERLKKNEFKFITNISWGTLWVDDFSVSTINLHAKLVDAGPQKTRIILSTGIRAELYFVVIGWLLMTVFAVIKGSVVVFIVVQILMAIMLFWTWFYLHWQEKYLFLEVKRFLTSLELKTHRT